MKLLKTIGDKNIWLLNYTGNKFELPFEAEPFVCLIWNHKKDFLSEELVNFLLASKCKHFVTGGIDSGEWNRNIEHLFLEQFYPKYIYPDSEHVMNTWYEKESIEEVIWQALNTTNFDDYVFKQILLIQVGGSYEKKDILEKIEEAEHLCD